MGAQQSSGSSNGPSAPTSAKTCYYELLNVDRQATDEEIKKAYRKRALELHPDRNLNNVEQATQKFAEIQSAYEVLSDPQERAWYDSHRDAILSGQDDLPDGAEPTHFRNVRLTSTEEILSLMRRFNTAIPFDDEPTGFYGIARETFEHLALEEEAAAEAENIDCPEYPTFGSSDDDYETVVRPFYNVWTGFSTKKTFSWKDKYRLSDAPDRRVRRLMEKENKQLRDTAIKEFHDAVRFLVSFVRKRDPRYLPNKQTEADRQRSLRDAAAAQAARSRAANAEKMAMSQVPLWAQTSHQQDTEDDSDTFEDSDEEIVEILECIVCNKTFKSNNQLDAHERSKKHIKALQQLKRQMKKEGAELDLGDAVGSAQANEQKLSEDDQELVVDQARDRFDPELGNRELDGEKDENMEPPSDKERTSPYESDSIHDDDDDYAPRSAVQGRLAGEEADAETDFVDAANQLKLGDDSSKRKVGKAKAKREKKAARQAQAEAVHRCSVCNETYASRNELFDHIRKEDHAAAVPRTAVSGKKKRQ